MLRKIFSPLLILLIFSSCSKEKPEIRILSEQNHDGTYLVKWETFPSIAGTVKIYPSANSDSFDLGKTAVEGKDIASGYAVVNSLPECPRTYYKLVFNNKYSVVTTARTVPMEMLFNFRDLGGYNNKENRQIKWGKVYRSSSIGRATKHDVSTLKQLGIKTIIDLRAEQTVIQYPSQFEAEQIHNYPFRGNRYNVFFDQVLSGEMKKKDILDHLQKLFYFFAENNSDYLIQIFDILLDESNYPVVISCSLGKDRAAMVTAIILAALDVNDSTIISDYLLSNDLIDYHSQAENASQFDAQIQENLTALFSAHRETIIYTLEKLKEDFGSIDNYLQQELNLTPEKRAKLKDLLLYP